MSGAVVEDIEVDDALWVAVISRKLTGIWGFFNIIMVTVSVVCWDQGDKKEKKDR